MIDKKISKKYAKGLFEETVDKNRLEQVYDDLNKISEVFREEPDFLKLMNCGTIPFVEKNKIIDKIFSNAEDTSLNFLKLLFRANRGLFYFDIFKEFYKLYLNKQNKIEMRVVSAYYIEDTERTLLRKILETKIKKEVILKFEINKEIIGGMVIYCKDLVIDASIKYQLENLRGIMKSTRN